MEYSGVVDDIDEKLDEQLEVEPTDSEQDEVVYQAKFEHIKEDMTQEEIKNELTEVPDVPSLPAPLPNSVSNVLSAYYTDKELEKINESMDEDSIRTIQTAMLNMKTGRYSSLPRVCAGKKCPSAHVCPFVQTNTEFRFIGKRCPVEIIRIEQLRETYREALEDSNLGSGLANMNRVNDLIECDILIDRLNAYLSNTKEHGGGEIIEITQMVNPKTGEEVKSFAENPAMSSKMYLEKKKQKVLQDLILTPYWQKKLIGDPGGDEMKKNRDILERAKEYMKNKSYRTVDKDQDADYEVIDDDDNLEM